MPRPKRCTASTFAAIDAARAVFAEKQVGQIPAGRCEAAGTDTASGTADAASDDAQTAVGTDGGNGKPAGGTAATTGEAATAEPETVEQAPLKESKTSVIIRRGDTLWQISRRIYGKGVRYTTIYLANEDQITDPDRIIPGQVFGVPDKTAETDAEAEEMHRKHVRGN